MRFKNFLNEELNAKYKKFKQVIKIEEYFKTCSFGDRTTKSSIKELKSRLIEKRDSIPVLDDSNNRFIMVDVHSGKGREVKTRLDKQLVFAHLYCCVMEAKSSNKEDRVRWLKGIKFGWEIPGEMEKQLREI